MSFARGADRRQLCSEMRDRLAGANVAASRRIVAAARGGLEYGALARPCMCVRLRVCARACMRASPYLRLLVLVPVFLCVRLCVRVRASEYVHLLVRVCPDHVARLNHGKFDPVRRRVDRRSRRLRGARSACNMQWCRVPTRYVATSYVAAEQPSPPAPLRVPLSGADVAGTGVAVPAMVPWLLFRSLGFGFAFVCAGLFGLRVCRDPPSANAVG